MKRTILVKTNFEGIHQYVNAPDEVAFLREPHRHIFNVEVEMEVFHDDRELEFIMVKHRLNQYLYDTPFDVTSSCEQMAQGIIDFLLAYYGPRQLCVTVLEDNENGGRVYHEN